jgi:sigma-E factor negative regulatory protein RseA
MLDEVNVKISQFVDGELTAKETFNLLKNMQEKPELADVYRRYEAVSQALKTDVFLAADEDFVARVSARIEAEPTVFCPPRRTVRSRARIITAAAASLAAAAVIVAGLSQQRGKPLVGGMELAQRQPESQLYAASSRPQADDARFNEYLEAHGATLYSGGSSVPQAYGQVVGYGRK